jgi:hypothetical protein
VINAWKTDDHRLMSDLGEVHGRPHVVRCGESLHVSEHPGPVTMVSRNWFDELREGPDNRMGASRNGDILTLRFDHVGGVGQDLDGYTTVDDSMPPGEWRYRVLRDLVRWSDLDEPAPDLALAVAL